jgi:hypothetical protein
MKQVTIRLTPETHADLVAMAGKLQTAGRARVTLDKTIKTALDALDRECYAAAAEAADAL